MTGISLGLRINQLAPLLLIGQWSFISGVDGWVLGNTNGATATLTSASGRLVVTQVGADGNGHWGQVSVPTVSGQVYTMQYDYVSGALASPVLVRAGGASITIGVGVIASTTDPAIGTRYLTFTANASTSWLAVGGGLSAGGSVTFDNIKLWRGTRS